MWGEIKKRTKVLIKLCNKSQLFYWKRMKHIYLQ
jgi:hypothetical protein